MNVKEFQEWLKKPGKTKLAKAIKRLRKAKPDEIRDALKKDGKDVR